LLSVQACANLESVIDHVQIACPPGSESVLRAFYVGVLGLAEKPKPPLLAVRGGCWFTGYGIELHLGVEEDFRPARKAHPGLVWPDGPEPARDGAGGGADSLDGGVGGAGGAGGAADSLDALAARLTDAGYPVRWADPAEIPGRRRFHTEDPHGNRLEFLAPV
jgi:catechol 2,3-dioxygenase-like lactoylglutathione lyase family enzyme